MKTFHPLIKQCKLFTILSIFFFSFTFISKGQTCNQSAGILSWTTSATIANVFGVIAMSGQMVKNWSNYNAQELRTGGLKAGIYSVTINNTMTSEKETVRLVVIR